MDTKFVDDILKRVPKFKLVHRGWLQRLWWYNIRHKLICYVPAYPDKYLVYTGNKKETK